MMFKIIGKPWVLFLLIVLLAFVLRLYRLDNPLADWHSWRQADTSAVSRNFIKYGFDLLHPRFDDISNVASGRENPNGYRFVEFPLYNAFHALFFKFFPIFSFETWGRLVSIFFSLGSLFFLYFITRKYLGTQIALLTSFFFAILPYNIYYDRVILPEPMMIFAGLGAVFFFDKWIENAKILNALLAIIFTSVSLLVKPFSAVYLLPVLYASYQRWRFNLLKWISLLFFLLVSFAPFALWRLWIKQYPEGIPAYELLFNEAGIRFKGAFFWWIFAERIGKLVLGLWGLIPFGLGLAVKPSKKEGLFFYFWLFGVTAYLFIVAGGNVRHDYYQILTIPIICVFLAKGAYFLLNPPKEVFTKAISYSLLTISCLFMLAFSWYQARDFFNINNSAIIAAGKEVDKLLPKDAKVIAPYGGDTAFLYQTNRQGWPVGIEIEKMINLGAQYYVNINFGPETQWVLGNYCLLKKTDSWVIVDLTKKCHSKL